MAWAITADPQRFDEACDFFLKRAVITREEAERLDDDSRQRAFWVGGGLQLKQVQRVFDALNEAIEKGEPFKDFQKRMAGVLRDPAHAETVFRNAAQKAFNAGRYRQLREVQPWRPFWLYDSILDSRTSSGCRTRNGTTLPAEHPWWSSNFPPRHHRCRAGIRSLTRQQAAARGITVNPARDATAPGWGALPDNDPVWKPDPRNHDAALLAELERKAARPKTLKPKQNPRHNPGHWEKEYSHLGDAAPAAAYGRAMLERALDRPIGEIRDELLRLQQAGHPALEGVDIRSALVGRGPLNPEARLRGTVFGQRAPGLLALSEHTRTIKPGDALQLGGDRSRATEAAERFYALTLDRSVTRPKGWRYTVASGVRATADDKTRTVNLDSGDGAPIAVHELAHAIEFSDARALRRSVAFLIGRTRGEKLQKLSALTKGGTKYRDDEEARPDKFLSFYVGKDYAKYTKSGDYYATEVTAMGYQWMAGSYTLPWLAERDAEMLFFLLGQLAGK